METLALAQTCKIAVQATVGGDGMPQAAAVGVVVSDDFEIFFDTNEGSRKLQNLRRDPRTAVVMGWDDEWTLQIEGVADEPKGEELARLKTIYFARFPDGLTRETWSDIAYVRIRPTWIRLSDFRGKEPRIVTQTR